MEELYNMLKTAGETVPATYGEFKNVYGSSKDAQKDLHQYLTNHPKKYVTTDFDQWSTKYFSGEKAVMPTEKKKPEEVVSSVASGVPPGTGSPTTPTPNGEVVFEAGSTIAPAGDLATPDAELAALMQKPTEDLLYGYVHRVMNKPLGVNVPISASDAKQAVSEINRIRASGLPDHQKLIEAKRVAAKRFGGISSGFGEELQKSEDILRQSDKAGFNQMLDRRISETAITDPEAVSLPGFPGDPEANYKNKLFQSAASVAFEPGSPRQQEAFLVARLERLRATPGAEAKAQATEDQLKSIRSMRLTEINATIDQDEENLSIVEDPKERQQLQAQLDQARKEADSYLNPEKAALDVYTKLGPEVQQVPGKTPMEKMRNQLVRLEQERRDLEKSLTAADAVEGFFHDTERGKRLAEIDNQMKAIGSVVYFNEGPLTSPEEGAGSAFGRSFADQLMPKGWMKTDVSRQEKAQGILNSLAQSGVDINTYDPSKLEALKKKSEGYGMGDPRMWTEMLGGTAAFMVPAMVGGAATAPLKVGKAIQGTKFLGRASGVIAEMVESGLAYEAAGRIFPKDSDQLNVLSGALGGLGKGIIPAFGKNADAATKAILGRLGSGAGETAEEFGNTIGEVWKEHGMDNFWKGMGDRFPNADETFKFVVSTFAMGIALGSGTEAGKTLMDQGQKAFDQAPIEQQAEMQAAIDELKSEAITVQQAGAEDAVASADPQAEVKTEEELAREKAKAFVDQTVADVEKENKDLEDALDETLAAKKLEESPPAAVVEETIPSEVLETVAETPTEVKAASESIQGDLEFDGIEDALADIDLDDEVAITEALAKVKPVAKEAPAAGSVEQKPMDVVTAATVVDSYESDAKEKKAATQVLAQEGMESDGKGKAVPAENPLPAVKAKQAQEAQQEVTVTKKVAKPKKGAKAVGESGAAFEEKTSSGRVTEWKKEGDKWMFRNQAPKGSSAKYTAPDWQQASEADVKRVEEMASLTREQLDVRNALGDLGSKWKAMGKMGGLYSGADPRKVLDLLESVTNLGVALMKSGVVDLAQWTESVKAVLDEKGIKLDKLLPKLYDKAKARFEKPDKAETPATESAETVKETKTESSTESTDTENTGKPEDKTSLSPEPPKDAPEEKEKKEPKPRVAPDPLSTTGETRQRGLEQTLLKHGETFGDFLTDLVKETPNMYEKIDFEEVMAVAKNRIEEEGLAAVHKELTTRGNVDPVVSAMQGIAMQMYSKMGQNAVKAGDMELAAKLNDALDEIIVTAGADATQRGQANGIISQFGFIAPYMDTYVQGRYNKLMDAVMKAKDSKGRSLKEKTTAAAKDLNKAKKAAAEQIADSVTSSKAVTDAKADPKRQTVKANIAAAKAELSQALRAGASAKSGIPIGEALDVVAAATKLGYWTILDGAYKISDFMKKMKAAGLQDEDLINDIWENSEFNGTKLSDLAVDEMKRASAETVTKGVGAEKKTATESAKAKAEYTKAIRDAIAGHLVDPDGRTLENVLIEDLAMSTEDAVKVKAAVEDKTIEMIGGYIERAANSIQSGVAKKQSRQVKAEERAALSEAKKTVAGRLAMALVDGDLTPESVAGKMAEQLGLPADLTPEMKADLRNKAMAIRDTQEGSKIRTAAEWEFAKAASEALKHIGKDKGFLGKVFNKKNAQIYTSFVYSAMLNGLPTHLKNFLSVMPAVFSFGLSGVFNTTKWVRAAKRAQEYTGPLSKKEVFFFNSPAYEFFFRWKHGNSSFKSAKLEAIDVIRTGKGQYRWEDEVKKGKEAFDQIVESIPVLERTKFLGGNKNPFSHVFGKLVGRALSATDALTSLYYENQEVAFALVGAGLDAGMTMQQIDTKMKQFFTKNNLKWQESMTEAQEEAEIAKRFGVDIKESTIKAEAARLMREKVKTEFGITEERGEALRDVARDRIFAHKRHGVIGQLAATLGGVGNLGGKKAPFIDAGIKALMKPVVPFTNIVGNMGDALLDTLPIYGLVRANGWGATAIAARLFNKTWSIEDSKTSMMGKRINFNDDLYVQQLSRAVTGTLAVVALAMIAGDDDDDLLHFTGNVPGNPGESYKVMMYKKKLFDYRMLPELYLPIRFIQASKEFLKQPQNKGKYGTALATAYMASVMSIKDMSFLDGLATFIESFSYATQSLEGAASNAEKIGGTLSTVTKGLLSQHINFLLKPIPTNQGIVKNFEKIVSPEKEGSQDLEERMYYLLGLQSVMGNQKKIDISGNTIKALPGDDILPLTDWFSLNEDGKEVNKISMEQDIKPTWPLNQIRTYNEPDPESGSPYTQRMMTPAEYTEVSIQAGKYYSQKVLDYKNGDLFGRKYDTDKDIEFKETSGKSTSRAKKVLDGFRGYAWGRAMKEKFGSQVLTQDEFNTLIGQHGL